MRLRHAQRQLLARSSLRCYSTSAVSGKNSVSTPDAVAASGTSAPPRTRRPLASSFGGISIQNVAIPSQSQGFRNRTNRPSRADDSKSSNTPRTYQQERNGATRKPAGSSMSDWGDGLVSLSFSSRLKMHQQKKMSPQNADARSEDQDRRQYSKPRQHAQTQSRQHDQGAESYAPRSRDRQYSPRTEGRQHEQRTESHTPRSRDRQNSTRGTTQTSRQQPAAGDKPRTAQSKMTRPPNSRLSTHSQHPKPTSTPAPKDIPSSTTTETSLASRAAQLTVLANTDLDALLQTRSTPMAGTTYTTLAEYVLRQREYATGDYSRYLPHRVGVSKNASRPHALRTAHLALARQRDVALKQRDFALNIIGGLAEPRRQVSA